VANELSGVRVAFLTANEGVEQVELTTPWQAVQDAGGTPELLAPKAGQVQAFNHLDKGDTFPAPGASPCPGHRVSAAGSRWVARPAMRRSVSANSHGPARVRSRRRPATRGELWSSRMSWSDRWPRWPDDPSSGSFSGRCARRPVCQFCVCRTLICVRYTQF